MNQGNFTDKDFIQDLLISEKFGASAYTNSVVESSCANLRQVLIQAEQSIDKNQEDVFNAMNARGWYPTKKAEAQEVQQAKDTFSSMQYQLH